MQASPKHISPTHLVPKLEAEIRHNQRRIERLRQRNARLTQRLEQIEPKYHPQSIPARAASTATRTAKSRPLKPKPPQLSRSLLAVGMLLVCLTICCGAIGFAVARLIAVR